MSDTTGPSQLPPKGTVLVVDDEPDVRQIVGLLLRREGHEVLEAGDGEAALHAVREAGNSIDAVLLDVMMPRMTGHEALPAIRELQPEMPVVFFSGYDRGEVTGHLQTATAHTTFVPKPFTNEQLLAAISEAISASSRHRGPRTP
ncbi:MAG: response regulator [Actinomycetota bacterium]|nr:response regulator [Actinomycetota bacterium]